MTRNPLFNANRMKLGIFGTNGKGGAQTLVPEAYKPTWPASVQTAQMADAAGFEAIVAYARWKSYIPGRPNHPSGIVMDPFTWAAGIAQATSYSAVFATSHAPTIHPITCAKQCATIDIISNGRFGLNVVGGWNKHELEMFGAPMKEHDARYDHLAEWLEVMERMWREDEEFDFDGEFYKVVRGASFPKPIQQPRPPIMNAGGSPRGLRFACEHADMCFVILKSDDPAVIRKQIDEYKVTAREQFGREVQVWTYCPVVQRDTRREAEDYLNYYAVEMEDSESLDAWSAGLGAQTQILDPSALREFRKRFAAGAGGNILVGTADDIANQLHTFADAGLDGVLCTWVDFIDGLNRLIRDVLPILESRGLRQPFGAQQPAAMAANS
ncbi:LLM class flavin-dependent oxidoreductase [Rhodoligotrophos defluvii]|uniref:LLM class flavin-dependent oxidoreductase n=1 Tax=Rhodoligotrophos defluvii TaxID=2561934 RepID=UPI0010C94A6A|nr:LLM class flavin-dependent oxidoreductase [Rhodoligotrophos defluvii]